MKKRKRFSALLLALILSVGSLSGTGIFAQESGGETEMSDNTECTITWAETEVVTESQTERSSETE